MREVFVKLCAVRFLQSSAQAKVGELHVAAGVKEKVVRLDVPATE